MIREKGASKEAEGAALDSPWLAEGNVVMDGSRIHQLTEEVARSFLAPFKK